METCVRHHLTDAALELHGACEAKAMLHPKATSARDLPEI